MLQALERIETQTGRWEWCRDTESNQKTYYHVDCDLVTDEHGFCIGCGKPGPAAVMSDKVEIKGE